MEELNAGDDTKTIPVFHYAKEPNRIHGVPCKFVLLEVRRRSVCCDKRGNHVG